MSSPRGRVRSRRKAITVAVAGAASPVGEPILRALLDSAAGGRAHRHRGRAGRAARGGRRRALAGGRPRLAGGGGLPQRRRRARPRGGQHAISPSTCRSAPGCGGSGPSGGRRRWSPRRRRPGSAHLVVVTSAMTYGALPDNPVPLPEDAPLRAEPDEGLVGDLLAVEEVLQQGPPGPPGALGHRGAAGGARRPGHRHRDHPALRGTAAAHRRELHPGLAVLPRRGPGPRRRRRGRAGPGPGRHGRGRGHDDPGAGRAGQRHAARAAQRGPRARHRAAAAPGRRAAGPGVRPGLRAAPVGGVRRRRCVRRGGRRRTTTRPAWGCCWTGSAGTTPWGRGGSTARTRPWARRVRLSRS